MNKCREYATSVVVQECNKEILYVLGGYQDIETTLASVEKYVVSYFDICIIFIK